MAGVTVEERDCIGILRFSNALLCRKPEIAYRCHPTTVQQQRSEQRDIILQR
jgi:hypothetical protein